MTDIGFTLSDLIEAAKNALSDDSSYRSDIRNALRAYFNRDGKISISWKAIHNDLSTLTEFKQEFTKNDREAWTTYVRSLYSHEHPTFGIHYHIALLFWFHLPAHQRKIDETAKLNQIGDNLCLEIFGQTANHLVEEHRSQKEKIKHASSPTEVRSQAQQTLIERGGGVSFETENIVVEQENHSTASRTDNDHTFNTKWRLTRRAISSIDELSCNFDLQQGQTSNFGDPVDLIASISISPIELERGFQFGLRSVAVMIGIDDDQECDVYFPAQARRDFILSEGVIGKVSGPGISSKFEIFSTNLFLDGDFVLRESHFCTIKPRRKIFTFESEMVASTTALNLVKLDGSPLPSENKQIIIKALAVREILQKRKGAIVTLARRRFKIEEDER